MIQFQDVLMHFNDSSLCDSLHLFIYSDPMNGRVLQNVEKYEKLLGSAGASSGGSFRRPSSTYLRTQDTYERLCLTQGSQVIMKMSSLDNVLK